MQEMVNGYNDNEPPKKNGHPDGKWPISTFCSFLPQLSDDQRAEEN
jgi:hypothetical protein